MSDEHRRQRAGTALVLDDERAIEERRNHERIPVNGEFACIADYIAEYVTSISPGGVFIRSQKPLPVGTRVDLKFSVILDDVETVEGEGEVVRVQNEEGNKGMGVAFTRLSAQSKELIDRIVERYES